MSLKDTFDRMLDYFTEDEDEVIEAQSTRKEVSQPAVAPKAVAAPAREVQQRPVSQAASRPQAQVASQAQTQVRSQQTTRPVAQASGQNVRPVAASNRPAAKAAPTDNITRLHERQRELSASYGVQEEQVTIDVRYPRKYEEAPEIVDLLLSNESILIDFQYMTEVQARRCLDYLDGARTVLAGNLKRVASTMYLLTPVNVVVNIEDLRLPEEVLAKSDFDFDMKRR